MADIISKNLRKLRLEKNMTQEQMAEQCGVTAQTVSRWETGVTFPDIMLLPIIARMFGVLVDDLFKESPEGYINLAERLLEMYGHTHRHEDFMVAASEYEKLVKSGEATAYDYKKYGILHQLMVESCLKKAYEYFDKAMLLYKDTDEEAYYGTKWQNNMLRIKNGQAEACIEEQKQAVKDAPDNQNEWKGLLSAYFWAEQYEECYQTFLEVIKRFPDNPDWYIYGGDSCRFLKRYDEAFVYWKKPIEMGADFLDTKYSMAFCYEELGEYEKACEQWDEIIECLRAEGLDETLKWPEEMRDNCRRKM